MAGLTKSEFANPVINWIDTRLPIFTMMQKEYGVFPTPKNFNYFWNFGALAMVNLVIMIITGIFLAMNYQPNTELAFNSVQHIMRDVNYGWLLRFMHATGASAFFLVIYIHMARTMYYGSYRAPRELMWWTGQGLLLMLMATAFMGYLLPWGQMSFWGATVITNLFRATPFIGEHVVIWLRGDYSVGDATLTRFFSLHYLLPFLIIGGVLVHLVALHTVKSSNPSGIDLAAKNNIPFHPYFTIKDLYGLGIFLIVYCIFVFFLPNSLMEPANNIPANPMQTPLHIVPEWYFLPFYAILRSVPNLVGGVVAMGLSVMMFAFMPYLDRSRIPGGASNRPIVKIGFYLFLLNMLVLGYVGYTPPTNQTILIGQIATLCYFGSFFLIPFISVAEERWLIRRGLPPEVEVLIASEASGKTKMPERRHNKGDMA
jgi:quinol-cytochrome oxidoreductase complex cytochrome b subunit